MKAVSDGEVWVAAHNDEEAKLKAAKQLQCAASETTVLQGTVPEQFIEQA